MDKRAQPISGRANRLPCERSADLLWCQQAVFEGDQTPQQLTLQLKLRHVEDFLRHIHVGSFWGTPAINAIQGNGGQRDCSEWTH